MFDTSIDWREPESKKLYVIFIHTLIATNAGKMHSRMNCTFSKFSNISFSSKIRRLMFTFEH